MSDIVLYHSIGSRAFVALWMLEEIGVPYRIANTDIHSRANKSREYLRINPMGKVPALTDGDAVVTEIPAICIYLADKYAYGTLAPKIETPERAAYLRWSVFATAVLEPATYLPRSTDRKEAFRVGWGDCDAVIDVLEQALTPGPFLLGETFIAADVALGGIFSMAMFNKRLPERPAFVAYNKRLEGRPAYQRASQATWPPHLYKPS